MGLVCSLPFLVSFSLPSFPSVVFFLFLVILFSFPPAFLFLLFFPLFLPALDPFFAPVLLVSFGPDRFLATSIFLLPIRLTPTSQSLTHYDLR